jgi:hypothetical protein
MTTYQEMFRQLRRNHQVRYEDLPLESRRGRRQEVEVVANLYQEDGTPVTLQDTDLFERALDKAMGPPAAGVYIRPRAVAEAAPDTTAPTVPFLIVEPGAVTWQVIWNNTQVGEWAVLVGWLLVLQWLFTHAWNLPWRSNAQSKTAKKDFVHPSLRRIDADQPEAPKAKISYTPRKTPPAEAPAPASAAPSPASTIALPPRGPLIFGPDVRPILFTLPEEQKQKYLLPVLRGEKFTAFAQSEPEAGADPGSMRTTAVRDGDHYVINGYKRWITNAGRADFFQLVEKSFLSS